VSEESKAAATTQSADVPPAVSVSSRANQQLYATAEQYRCFGKERYISEDYKGAYEAYSKSLDIGTDKWTGAEGVLSNRAATLMMLERFPEVSNTIVIQLMPILDTTERRKRSLKIAIVRYYYHRTTSG
jgi:hypothetical protein